jgi:AraC-like DNA-binding protein
MSRSTLHERFVHFIGQPPMQYLAQWRMQLAAHRLGSGGEGVAAIAFAVGYESEAAFSRAFKKLVGVPPSEWRRRRARGTAAPSD